MGWLYTLHKAEPGEIMRQFTKPWTNSKGHDYQITDASFANWRHLWGVLRIDGEPVTIILWLVDRRRDEWGYKDMEESMGPFYYTCPLRLLDIAPEENSEWREHVRAFHERRSRKVTVGQRLVLKGFRIGATRDPEVEITSVKPLRVLFYGRPYRLTKAMVGAANIL